MPPRKKEATPPLFDVKHKFLASFENVCQQATMMLTVAATIIQHGDLKPATKEVLAERTKALRDSLYAQERED